MTETESELRAEMLGYLRDKQEQRWHWVYLGDRTIKNPVFRADGTASADNATELEALQAMVGANRRRRERRAEAAAKAAATRARRRDKRFQAIVQRLKNGGTLQPSGRCGLCGRHLDDPESINRGIGSECWSGVLSAIETVAKRS